MATGKFIMAMMMAMALAGKLGVTDRDTVIVCFCILLAGWAAGKE